MIRSGSAFFRAFIERKPGLKKTWALPPSWAGNGFIRANFVCGFCWRPRRQKSIQALPYPSTEVARVIHTRLGRGGVPGQPRPAGARKFVIDFEGGPLPGLRKSDDVEVVVNASRGTIGNAYALQVVGTERWRAFFDLYAGDGPEPVDLRCFLRLGGRTLTETWLYQYLPFDYGES